MKSKSQLRKEILRLRDALSLEIRREKSRQITKRIITHHKFLEADKVLLFASYKSEVDTSGIFGKALQIEKQIYFPKVQGKEMEFYQVTKKEDLLEGYRGIFEPEADEAKKFCVEAEDKIFVLMPGAVFDEIGNRIGYGGGYYDKFLEKLEHEIPREQLYKAAAAFDCQVLSRGMILTEDYDIQPDCIVTEEKLYQMCRDADWKKSAS